MPAVNIVGEDVLWILFFLFFSIAIGILGYRLFVGFGWFQSFYNASVILSSTGIPDDVSSMTGKTFIAFYSLYSGLVFLIIFAIIIGRIIFIANNS